MHPFLDMTKLSDDELTERITKAHMYMRMQTGLGHTPAVTSIREVIEGLENERFERMARATAADDAKRNPNKLKPIELGRLND